MLSISPYGIAPWRQGHLTATRNVSSREVQRSGHRCALSGCERPEANIAPIPYVEERGQLRVMKSCGRRSGLRLGFMRYGVTGLLIASACPVVTGCGGSGGVL